MKYLVLIDDNGIDATVITPIPPKVDLYQGSKLILETVPVLPDGHKYIISNGALTTSVMSVQETATIDSSKLRASYQEANFTTDQTLEAGFSYSGETFSLDPLLREHWTRLYMYSRFTQFSPTNVPTLDQTTFQLTSNNIQAFWDAFQSKMIQVIEADRIAKKAIKDNQ